MESAGAGPRRFFLHRQALILFQAHQLDELSRRGFFLAVQRARDARAEVRHAQRMQAVQFGQRCFRGRRCDARRVRLSLCLLIVVVLLEQFCRLRSGCRG